MSKARQMLASWSQQSYTETVDQVKESLHDSTEAPNVLRALTLACLEKHVSIGGESLEYLVKEVWPVIEEKIMAPQKNVAYFNETVLRLFLALPSDWSTQFHVSFPPLFEDLQSDLVPLCAKAFILTEDGGDACFSIVERLNKELCISSFTLDQFTGALESRQLSPLVSVTKAAQFAVLMQCLIQAIYSCTKTSTNPQFLKSVCHFLDSLPNSEEFLSAALDALMESDSILLSCFHFWVLSYPALAISTPFHPVLVLDKIFSQIFYDAEIVMEWSLLDGKFLESLLRLSKLYEKLAVPLTQQFKNFICILKNLFLRENLQPASLALERFLRYCPPP